VGSRRRACHSQPSSITPWRPSAAIPPDAPRQPVADPCPD
jgi:hypothetical protein